jgi:hypothetical protein
MATKLLKNLVRESTETIDSKEILVTLTEDQEIELKIKGTRGRGETIYIKELYGQLYGVDTKDSKPKEGSISVTPTKPKRGDNKMISLYDLRSHNAISVLDLATIAKFDQIIKSVIDSY